MMRISPEVFRNDPNLPERISDHDMPVAYFTLPEATPPVRMLTIAKAVKAFHTLASNGGSLSRSKHVCGGEMDLAKTVHRKLREAQRAFARKVGISVGLVARLTTGPENMTLINACENQPRIACHAVSALGYGYSPSQKLITPLLLAVQ